MKKSSIDGIGSMYGGEYEDITVDGIGKLKSSAKARNVKIDGIFKGKGRIDTDSFTCDGIARVFRDIKARNVRIEGIMKLRRAKLEADSITSNGIIICNREVSADKIFIDGACFISRMYGDTITIRHKQNWNDDSRMPSRFRTLLKLYFGRTISLTHSLVDVVECTRLEAVGIKSKTIKANYVKLGEGCIVDHLECDGEMDIHPSCIIGKINNKIYNCSEEVKVNNTSKSNIEKILDMYKAGKIDVPEAEKLLNMIFKGNDSIKGPTNEKSYGAPWEDDNKIRIVVFRGRRLLKKGEAGSLHINVDYPGEVLNVECHGSINCGEVHMNASAGGSIKCGDIGGNVSAGGSIHCGNISGKVAAGGGVHISR